MLSEPVGTLENCESDQNQNQIMQILQPSWLSPDADADRELREKESVSPLDEAWVVWEAAVWLKYKW